MTKNFLNLSLSNILPNSWGFTARSLNSIFLHLITKGFKSFSFSLSPYPSPSSPLSLLPLPLPLSLNTHHHHLHFLDHSGRMTSILVNICIIEKNKDNFSPIVHIFCFPPSLPYILGMTLSKEGTQWNRRPYFCQERCICAHKASSFSAAAFRTTQKTFVGSWGSSPSSHLTSWSHISWQGLGTAE